MPPRYYSPLVITAPSLLRPPCYYAPLVITTPRYYDPSLLLTLRYYGPLVVTAFLFWPEPQSLPPSPHPTSRGRRSKLQSVIKMAMANPLIRLDFSGPLLTKLNFYYSRLILFTSISVNTGDVFFFVNFMIQEI